MIFVHGFGESQAQSIRHMANLEVETASFKGEKLLFDWQTQPSAAYVADLNSALRAREELATLLLDLTKKGVRVSLVAHSMGSFIATEAISQDVLTSPAFHLEHIVLAAPDIDLSQFKDLYLSRLLVASEQVRVYTNSDDLTLQFSSCLNHASRAGLGDDTTFDGKAMNVTGHVPLANYGHSYIFNSRFVAWDLERFLTNEESTTDYSVFEWLGDREKLVPRSVVRERNLIGAGCPFARAI